MCGLLVSLRLLLSFTAPVEFTGESAHALWSSSLVRIRVKKPGKVIELNRQNMMALIQSDAELGEMLIRAFILRRVELLASGVGDVVLIGSIIHPVLFVSKNF